MSIIKQSQITQKLKKIESYRFYHNIALFAYNMRNIKENPVKKYFKFYWLFCLISNLLIGIKP